MTIPMHWPEVLKVIPSAVGFLENVIYCHKVFLDGLSADIAIRPFEGPNLYAIGLCKLTGHLGQTYAG